MKTIVCRAVFLLWVLYFPADIKAQWIDTTPDRVKTPLAISWKRIGTLTPRSTWEIGSSRITVGCETIDRDYVNWDSYKKYLPPLGVKKIRLQAGWAKCEKVPGVYNWKWLDEIIDYAVQNNIEPWLQTSYGNPAYKGGGGAALLNSLMASPEALEAWDRWVAALVTRYKDRVKEWEIWNEPDHPNQNISPATTASLNIRTAAIIKRLQPEARIAGLAFASNSNAPYLDSFLAVIADQGKLDLFDWISYHSYNFRPEDSYAEKRVMGLKKVLSKYSDKILLRQGENGAPSTFIPSFALNKYYWTEYTQAKYDIRRLLGDLGHDIETSVFTIIDIYYNYHNENSVLNTKGLIQTDTSMAAIRPKVAYYAVQNVASLFDSSLHLIPSLQYETGTLQSISVYGYTHAKGSLLTIWLDAAMPGNRFVTTPVDITVSNMRFRNPVWVDLLTGGIYEIPAGQVTRRGSDCVLRNIPVYDSPVIITEKEMVIRNKK